MLSAFFAPLPSQNIGCQRTSCKVPALLTKQCALGRHPRPIQCIVLSNVMVLQQEVYSTLRRDSLPYFSIETVRSSAERHLLRIFIHT